MQFITGGSDFEPVNAERLEQLEGLMKNIATKDDIQDLKKEMGKFVLKSDFDNLRREMERFACKSDIEIVRTELRFIRWMLTAGVAIGLTLLSISTILLVNSVDLVIR